MKTIASWTQTTSDFRSRAMVEKALQALVDIARTMRSRRKLEVDRETSSGDTTTVRATYRGLAVLTVQWQEQMGKLTYSPAVLIADDMVDGKRAAICKFCANRQEMPKAFRMRQHIANCVNASEDAKVMVRLEQERKDEDARVKKVVQMKQKNMALKAAGASTSFDNLAEPSGASGSAQTQSLVSNPYGGLSTEALPMLPPANGHKSQSPLLASRAALVFFRATADKLVRVLRVSYIRRHTCFGRGES